MRRSSTIAAVFSAVLLAASCKPAVRIAAPIRIEVTVDTEDDGDGIHPADRGLGQVIEVTALRSLTLRRIVLNQRTGELDCDSAAPEPPPPPKSSSEPQPRATRHTGPPTFLDDMETSIKMSNEAAAKARANARHPRKMEMGDQLRYPWPQTCGIPLRAVITTDSGQRWLWKLTH